LRKRPDAAVQRILADDAAFPAELGQVVAGHGFSPGLMQGHQHLHDPRLERLDAFGPVNLQRLRANAQRT
jgi:hypothetical protein